MTYDKPKVQEVSLTYEEDRLKSGKDTASGCSGNCCYAKGSGSSAW